jgi:hypothetical protein
MGAPQERDDHRRTCERKKSLRDGNHIPLSSTRVERYVMQPHMHKPWLRPDETTALSHALVRFRFLARYANALSARWRQ